jgi:hypothetical protein
MTRQHLVGELSEILGELHDVAPDAAASRAISDLRLAAEATPPTDLEPVLGYALVLANRVCAHALLAGSGTKFIRDLAICVELRVWGDSAGLIGEGQ